MIIMTIMIIMISIAELCFLIPSGKPPWPKLLSGSSVDQEDLHSQIICALKAALHH